MARGRGDGVGKIRWDGPRRGSEIMHLMAFGDCLDGLYVMLCSALLCNIWTGCEVPRG